MTGAIVLVFRVEQHWNETTSPQVKRRRLRTMWATLGNVLIALTLVTAIGGGVALFVIARQDASRTGIVLGVLIVATAASMAMYVALGQHWL
jgi:hypothetical protein